MKLFDLFKKNKNKKDVKITTKEERYKKLLEKLYSRCNNEKK